jgi:hypothetical protein
MWFERSGILARVEKKPEFQFHLYPGAKEQINAILVSHHPFLEEYVDRVPHLALRGAFFICSVDTMISLTSISAQASSSRPLLHCTPFPYTCFAELECTGQP